ncbi:VirC2 family conjugal transfer protein [uncultured Roseibium sp.]|uniref:VirC2 family conjugal transfer protein n=1 Tax=uncultured Roseibium sp. TaxID=1936171 RepID=UPI002637F488|nr:VirC2 family conjugal transfer protein [uncultured Roseibium sp.]
MVIRRPHISVKETRLRAAGTQAQQGVAGKDRAASAAKEKEVAPQLSEEQRKPMIGKPTSAAVLTSESTRKETVQALSPGKIGYRKQLFISAPLPARGVSRSFDLLSQHHHPQKALQLILKRALSEYEIHVLDGSFKSFPQTYDELDVDDDAKFIQTSRMTGLQIVEAARAYFDPLGFESQRSFGRKYATAALAVFFHLEKKRR